MKTLPYIIGSVLLSSFLAVFISNFDWSSVNREIIFEELYNQSDKEEDNWISLMDSTIISPKQYQNYLVQDVNFNALNDYEFLLSIQVHVKDFNQWKQELVRYYPLLEQHDIKPICLLTTESSSEDVFMLLGCNNLIEVNNYTKKLLKTNIKDRAGILSFYNQNIYKRI